MSTLDDHLSVSKFMKLVDKCHNKEEILDLCEKGLKKYRPDALKPAETNPCKEIFIRPRQPPTYILRAGLAMDELHTISVGRNPHDVELYVTEQIVREMNKEIIQRRLVKIDNHVDRMMGRRIYSGTMEVIVK